MTASLIYSYKVASGNTGTGASSDSPIILESAASSAHASATVVYDTKTNFQTALATLNHLDDTNWEDISTGSAGRLYAYKTNAIAVDNHTGPLFKSVTVSNKNAVYVKVGTSGSVQTMYAISMQGTGDTYKVSDTAANNVVYVENYPSFAIELQGYAVQAQTNNNGTATDIAYSIAKTELQALYAKNHTA